MKILLVALLCLSCTHVPQAPASSFTAQALETQASQPWIVFNSDVNSESAETLIKQIQLADQGDKPILIEINTPGGSVFDGFEISRAIEATKHPVVCVVDGMAASMGLYILQSCHIRMMTHRSLLMGHEPSGGARGQQDDLKKMGMVLEKLNFVMAAHISFKTKLTPAQYMELIAHGSELWLTPDEALSLGFADFKVTSVSEAARLVYEASP